MVLFIFGMASGCATVSSNCLESIKSDIYRISNERDQKALTRAEHLNSLNDEISLVSAMELSNKVARAYGREYCDADYNEVRWDIQQKINFEQSMREIK
jgi:hypothetical protein